jgi:hypothetical protein
LKLERFLVHRVVRRHRVAFSALLLASVAIVVFLPLVMTDVASFAEAEAICSDRHAAIVPHLLLEIEGDASYNKKILNFAYSDAAHANLYPKHSWNVAALVISFLCELVWLYYSPHQGITSLGGKNLDLKCECFVFAL